MARGTAHAPKENAARRNRPTLGEASIVPDGRTRGPELPEGYGDRTIEWYETWRTSPQAQLFEATDWGRLLMLAPIVDFYFSAVKPSAAALSEIRLNEERLGATYVDRLRARIKIDNGDGPVDGSNVVALRSVGRAQIADRMKEDADSAPF